MLEERCPTCGSYLQIEWRCGLVLCTCGHGGRAWHQSVIGKCNYSNCKCLALNPKEAIIYPKGNSMNYKFLSGSEFIKFYNSTKEHLVFV